MNRKKLIYSILKELEQGNEPKKMDYDLDFEQWGEIAVLIKDEGYAKSIGVQYADNTVYYVSFGSAKITMKGIEFLEENNAWSKTYKGIKEIRDWLKL
ncbi:YjcQ family protein [Lysinibacillus sp. G4S2]|uniref:YjcQ family protein n=1 Tax=Lysinibacillus sp. G4S2 TaxID=3055859 RepID=UPI0025A15910|nr:YjcQ family protein [Lysinibacillus sp. G4S2]MDM5249639.1 YjcQ family protein [Lysinibacillus sp. G4S2]